MAKVFLEIGSKRELLAFLSDAKKKTGLLKDVSLNEMNQTLSENRFPIRIPIDLDAVLNLCGNPVLKKMFGKKVEDTTRKYIRMAMDVGR